MKNSMFRTSALLVSSLGLALTGCKNNQVGQPAPIVDGNAAANDPAAANLIGTQVAGVSYAQVPQSSATNYAPQTTAPVGSTRGQNEAYQYNTQPPDDQQGYYAGDPQSDANEYDQYAQLLDPGEGATQPPPPLPADYEQPVAPGPDYLWTPGYWDYANTGYYYVPGTWVAAPYQGALWTPGWWGSVGNRYRFHHGYWGRHVGYYGGINYGFGYIGYGYQGGYWNGDHFFYNREVNRVDPRRVNNYVYNRNISVTNREYINNTRISYYGPGGLNRRPAPQEFAALREQRIPPMQAQLANRRAAESNRRQFFTANNGRPAALFAARPLQADRNIAAPPRTMRANFTNNRPAMPNTQMPANASPQRGQQFQQQQRNQQQQANVQQTQQRNLMEQQRNQNLQQRGQNLQQQQANAQQRQQGQQQQRMQQQQANTQRLQQRQQADQQRQQAANVLQQQRQQQAQQLNQQRQQQQQLNVQRQQQANQQRQQQAQQANVQREQANQQRQQMNQQREQQANAQRQQQAQVQAQQQQQRARQMQQRQVQQQRVQEQRQQQMQARPAAAAPHTEAARPAPAPHMEGPHGNRH